MSPIPRRDRTRFPAAVLMAALLSVSDRMYDAPIGELLDELPLADEVAGAIVGGHGTVGRTLDIIRACERDDRLAIDELAPSRYDALMQLHRHTTDNAGTPEKTETPEPA